MDQFNFTLPVVEKQITHLKLELDGNDVKGSFISRETSKDKLKSTLNLAIPKISKTSFTIQLGDIDSVEIIRKIFLYNLACALELDSVTFELTPDSLEITFCTNSENTMRCLTCPFAFEQN